MPTTTETTIRALRREAGERLFTIARDGRDGTKAELANRIAACRRKSVIRGSRSKAAALEIVLELRAALATARREKAARRTKGRHWRNRAPEADARADLALRLEPPLEARLFLAIRHHVETISAYHYRHAQAGDDARRVLFVEPQAAAYTVSTRPQWDVYRGAHKNRPATAVDRAISIPRRWLRTVHRAGIAHVGGMLTLDAHPLVSPQRGVRLWGAVWAEQARGYDVRTVRGVIARDEATGTTHHGKDAPSAIAGLRRAIGWARLSASERAARSERTTAARVDGMARRHGAIPVVPEDAYAIGACRSGVEHWRHRVGLADRDSATVAEIAAGWRQYPAPEAIAAMRHAIRRT